jgi:TRAP-type C4-dicarboxylate transport system substrate-binding protein
MNLTDPERHIFLKCAEELSELSSELLQAVNKKNKENFSKITSEIKDVENRLQSVKETLFIKFKEIQ